MKERGRWVVLRTAWLLVGAAIGLATGLLTVALSSLIAPNSAVAQVAVILLCLVPALLLGLLPGVRELEVTAARTMLGVTSELVVPGRSRGEHRWRSILTVSCHLVAGLLGAILLVGVIPAAVSLAAANVSGSTELLLGRPVPAVDPALAVVLAIGCVGAALAGAWGLGTLSARLVGRLLGPTDGDRLEVALNRLQAESDHIRLARELHDGIGHALSIIGVQAAAGRRTLAEDPEQARSALGSIEQASRRAMEELDGMLGLLRDSEAARTPEPDLDRLDDLVATYRSAGMELVVEAGPCRSLPRLVSTTAYRVVAEALANAQRYSGPGPVTVRLQPRAGLLAVEVRNPRSVAATTGRGSGRGLTGTAERVALFGGLLRAGPEGSHWVLRAEIPTGTARG